MNPQVVARPNVLQSSPSPTSIITSINQSNFLCSQTQEPQSTLAASQQPFKQETDIFLHPDNIVRETKQHFKQVVIVQKAQNENISTEIPQGPRIQDKFINGQLEISCELNPNKQNYNLNNLVINNSDPRFNQQTFHGQSHKIDGISESVQINNSYDADKPKFYLPLYNDNGMHVQNTHLDNISEQYIHDQLNQETTKSVTEGNEKMQNIVIPTDNLYSDHHSNKEEDPPDK